MEKGNTPTQEIACLNPYSTGSNSNCIFPDSLGANNRVLILILLEVTQIKKKLQTILKSNC